MFLMIQQSSALEEVLLYTQTHRRCLWTNVWH